MALPTITGSYPNYPLIILSGYTDPLPLIPSFLIWAHISGHEWNALIVHSPYQIVHHPLQNLYHHHHYPIRLRIKPSSSLVMPDKSWSPALTLRLSGIPWRVPRSLRSLVHDPITNTNILMRYRILVALPKSTTRRARLFCQLGDGTLAQYGWLIAPALQRKMYKKYYVA